MDKNNNIRGIFEALTPTEEQSERVFRAIKNTGLKTARKIRLKWIPAAAAACACLAFTVCVMAATIPGMNRLLSVISPEAALMLQPIEMQCEDQGIRIETIAAMNGERAAVIYLTVQDCIADRIDETFRLGFPYSFSEANVLGYEIMGYDEATKAVTIRMTADGMENLNDKKAKLAFHKLIGKAATTTVDAGLRLADIPEAVNPVVLDLTEEREAGFGGDSELLRTALERGSLKILKMDAMDRPIPDLPSLRISNAGIIDGLLHVQIKRMDDTITDVGNFRLVDQQGNFIDNNPRAFHFNLDADGNPIPGDYTYSEYIIDPQDLDLNEVRMIGDFHFDENIIEGRWETTFMIRSVKEIKTIRQEIPVDGWTINRISLSPINLVLSSDDRIQDHPSAVETPVTIRITMKDGSSEEYTTTPMRPTDANKGHLEIAIGFSTPVDTENIQSITVNGNNYTY